MPGKLRLHVVPKEGDPYDFPLVLDSVLMGRSDEADLVFPDRYLSRLHSRLFRRGNQLLVEDLGSRNGTRVNGRPVRGPTPVQVGDVLQLSGNSVTLQTQEDTEPIDDDQGTASEEKPLAIGETLFLSASQLLERPAPGRRGELELRRWAERLQLVNEVHRALAQASAQDEILEIVLDRVASYLEPDQAAIFLRDEDGELQQVARRMLAARGDQRELRSRSLEREVLDKGLAALVLDLESDQRFAAAESIHRLGVRSLMAAPLLAPEGSLGMIVLSSRMAVRHFSKEDMELLVSLAAAAALSLRNTRLAEEAAERRRLEKELTLARRIQVALLPDKLPELPGYELQAGNLPSRHVSGDYYSVAPRAEGRECALLVADVAGKGLGASLLAAFLEALSAGPVEDGLPPEEVFALLSRRLLVRSPPERYATAFLAILEVASGNLRYANAGHVAGLHIAADGGTSELATTGPPLGLLESSTFQHGEAQLAAGDLLVLYTDGISETERSADEAQEDGSPDDEEYGTDRLAQVCSRYRQATLPDLHAAIERDLVRFAGSAVCDDDRTLLILRRQA